MSTADGPTSHFSWGELTRSATADERDIDNTPGIAARLNLALLAREILEPARMWASDAIGRDCPLIVHDAFRSAELNAAVGGSPSSQHMDGNAADITARPLLSDRDLFDVLRRSTLPYDQIILEAADHGGCVHISQAADGARPRGEALIRRGERPHWTYERVVD